MRLSRYGIGRRRFCWGGGSTLRGWICGRLGASLRRCVQERRFFRVIRRLMRFSKSSGMLSSSYICVRFLCFPSLSFFSVSFPFCVSLFRPFLSVPPFLSLPFCLSFSIFLFIVSHISRSSTPPSMEYGTSTHLLTHLVQQSSRHP